MGAADARRRRLPSAVFEIWCGEQRQDILTVGASEWAGHDKKGKKSPV
jgi:hypothetical protein